MTRNPICTGLLLAGLSLSVHAETEVMVVTADKSEQPLEQVNASVTVIDRLQIEQSAAPDLLELLRGVPGVQIARTGGHGAQTSLFLRGTNSNQMLVLIDGVRVSSPHTGSFAWEHLNLEMVERIEIVRGPRATTWGSDAIGGVIQIFTRRSTGVEATVYSGSYDRYGASTALRAAQGDIRFGATLAYDQSRGFSSQNPNGFSYDPDPDGYHNRSASLYLELPVGEQYRISAQANSMDGDSQFDQGTSYTRINRYSLKAEGQMSPRWSHSLQLSRSENDILTPAYFSDIRSSRDMLEWHNRYAFGTGSAVLFGADYQRQQGSSAYGYDDSQRNTGLYGQLDHQWSPGVRSTASLRVDQHSEYGRHTTGQISSGWDVSDSFSLYGNVGTAYRTPTLNELFHPGFGGFYAGNPNLKPETSTTAELGLRWSPGPGQRLQASLQQTDVDDLITYAGGETFQAINLKRARMQSLELEWSLNRGPHQLDASATVLDARDLDARSDLLRRPHQQYRLAYAWQSSQGLRLQAEWFHSGKARDFAATLDAYDLFNASATLPLGPRLQLRVRLENLLNEEYALAYGYNTPGRSVLFYLDWK